MLLAHLLVALVALVTLFPGLVVLRPELATRLYGIDAAAMTPEVRLMVRHRAVFFALTALLLGMGRVIASFRVPALVLAVGSKLAFVALAHGSRTLLPIARADVGLVAALLTAAWLDGDL